MSLKTLVFLLALALTLPTLADNGALVQVGENWRYLKTSGPGAGPGAQWQAVNFDDMHWRLAPSGFVVPDEHDALPGHQKEPARPGYVFLRKRFTVADPKEIKSLLLRVEHEEGFAAYLNGVEIARHRAKGVRYPTPADRAKGMEDAEVIGFEQDISSFIPLLKRGENTLAVEGPYTGDSPSPYPLAVAVAANFTRGPFVQNVTTNSIQIIWRTTIPSSTFVEYGVSPAFGLMVTNGALVTNHVVTLTGLSPNTPYFYRVGSATETATLRSTTENFRTFKMAGPIRFLVVGDTGQASAGQGQIATVMRNAQPDLVIHGGDILYSAPWTEANADIRIFNYYQAQMKSTPFYFALGNHDLGCCAPETPDLDIYDWQANATNFQRTFYLPTNSVTGTEHFYSFDHGDAHFVALYNPWFSAYVFTAEGEQYRWLTNDLAASRKPWKFMFMHSPIAHSGLHASADRGTPLAPPNGILDQTDMMHLLLPVAERYGVQVIFGSHEHNFERFAPTNGLHHLVTGGGGANNSSYNLTTRHGATAQFWLVHHCLSVTLDGDLLRVDALGATGSVFDSLVINRTVPSAQTYQSTWNTPVIETTPANDSDGNINGQTFNLAGPPILTRHGQFSNLGDVYVNNDSVNLYVGIKQAMFYGNNNIFLFLESPRLAGVASLAGLGNGLAEATGEGVDGLDFLENLSFVNFSPGIGCVLGDEFADGQFRFMGRGNLGLTAGQGIFRLDSNFSSVPGVRLQQFNRSPQAGLVANDANADLIEMAIPLSELGGLQPGDIIKIAAVVGGSVFNAAAQTRQLDTAVLGTFLSGAGEDPVVLGAVSVRLSFPPNLDTDGDGLLDNWELAYGLHPNASAGNDGATGDPDQDGSSNAEEQIAGTHPRDAQSVLRVHLTPVTPNYYRVSWNAVFGKKYHLEYANDQVTNFTGLAGGTWPRMAVSSEEVYGDDVSTNSPPPFMRSYRVRLVP